MRTNGHWTSRRRARDIRWGVRSRLAAAGKTQRATAGQNGAIVRAFPGNRSRHSGRATRRSGACAVTVSIVGPLVTSTAKAPRVVV